MVPCHIFILGNGGEGQHCTMLSKLLLSLTGMFSKRKPGEYLAGCIFLFLSFCLFLSHVNRWRWYDDNTSKLAVAEGKEMWTRVRGLQRLDD